MSSMLVWCGIRSDMRLARRLRYSLAGVGDKVGCGVVWFGGAGDPKVTVCTSLSSCFETTVALVLN